MADDSFVFVTPDDLDILGNNTATKMQVDSSPPEMKSLHVVSTIRNRYARTIVTSKYINQNTCAQEATFSIVLPDTAFIAGFVMEIKGKKYEAYVKEKQEAKQEYQQAVARGLSAAHVAVSARDSNKFTVSVNVEPQSNVVFNLTYEELLVRKHSKYEMIINLHPGHEVDDLNVDVYINETRPIINIGTPAFRSGNEIMNDKALTNIYTSVKKTSEGVVHISFHPTIEQQKEIAKSLLSENRSNGISGQFIIEYDVERDPKGGEVLVNDGYFVHFFAPTDLKPIPKHVVFVLDVSGSMQGRKIDQLKQAMKVILSELNSEDYFNIIKFSSDVQILYSCSLEGPGNISLAASTENIKKAQKVVGSMVAGGGTNIGDALITALSLTLKGILLSEKINIQPIIVFLTDGQANVGDFSPKSIIEKVRIRNEGENKAAIFTLAFGNDANKEFLKELAMKNSGFLRNIYEASDASLQLQDFYKQISSPLLTNVNFKYSEQVTETTKSKFDILFNGSEFVVTGKVGKMEEGFVVVEGSTLYGIDDFRPTIIPICPTKDEQFGSLERLWAYMTIKQLLDKKYEKSDDHNFGNETPEKQALELALKYSFVTPITSLVVVKPEESSENDLEWGSVRVASSDSLQQSVFQRQSGHSLFGCSGPGLGASLQQNNSNSLWSRQSSAPSMMYKRSIPANSNQCFGSFQPASSFASFPAKLSRSQPQQQQQQQQCLSRATFGQDMASNSPQNVFGISNMFPQNTLKLSSTDFPNILPHPPELKSKHVVTNVLNRYARTVMTSRYVNQDNRTLQATFSIVLPDNAFIAGLFMEISGMKYNAKMHQKEEAKKQFQEAIVQGQTAAHITSIDENSNKFTLAINVEQQGEITITLVYEQRLKQKDGKYEIITNLFQGQIIEDYQLDIKITDSQSITYVAPPFVKSNNAIMKCQIPSVNDDGSIHVTFKPTIEQQGISDQFVVEYKVETCEAEKEISVNEVPSNPPVTDLIVIKSIPFVIL